MTEHRQKIVALARDWIGTPYQHQAATKGVGTDCLGLIRGVWRGLYGQEPEYPPAYTMDWSEPQGNEALIAAAGRHLCPCSSPKEGSVLLFRMRRGAVAKHLGLLTTLGPEPMFIHAYSGSAVIEQGFGAYWQRRLVAAFDFPQG
jgi:NlpC/P60 family putative phage cell wall peptidase